MKMKNVEDIYPLSPMQQGMLFHTLYDPTSGVYFEQLSCTLSGEFDVAAFKRAWEEVMARHAVLRTAFLWEGLDKPLQVVRQKVALPWQAHDWRGVANQQEKLQTFLKEERQRGFELAKAPLMRCILIRLDEQKYEFVWAFHHVLMDGWSFPLVMKEMFAFYEAFSQGETLSLPRPRPYRTYIAWLQMQDMSNAEAYWRQTLKGFTAPTPLVVTKEGAKASDSYEDVYVELSEEVTSKLQALAKTHHLTLNTIIQGAWALLLSRYSGEKEVLFGSTVSGRPTELVGAESMVGLFINTLPMRIALSDEMDLMAWLQQVQAQAVEQRQYEYTPLVEIQGWSEVPRTSALFDSILVFENYPVDESLQEEPAGTLEIEAVESFDRTNYPLTVGALPGREFSLRLSYDSGYFEADTMQRMGGHLQTLLEGMAATPQQRVKELSLLTERERQQILVEWNQTEADYPAQWCIHEWIESEVRQTPHAVAVAASAPSPMLGGKSELTYHELNAHANQLAHYLRGLGVKAEVPVAICAERSVEMVIGLLAILKAGGAYVPLDPSYPKERLAFVLEDALGEVKVLLTQQKLLEDLPEMDRQTTVICLDTDVAASQSEENLVNVVTSENLAYIIYTSGSTGKPKGVQVSHQNLVHSTHARVTYYEEPPTSFLMLSSFAFDSSVESFGTLCAGGRLVLPPHDFQQEPHALAELIVQHQASYLSAIPSLYNLILTETDLAKLASLRVVIVGGEACPTELVKSHYERLPNTTLFNEYGPTEATVWSTVYKCRFPEERSQVPIGRAIANTKIYILDEYLQPVPLGVPGQLYIGGAGVARGYLNRPKLSKERFIDNPFGEGKLYNSGDMARYILSEEKDLGSIDFLGRADDQVKIRGFRIELGEVHAYLSQHANVREALVMAHQDNAGSKRLVAYFVPTEGLAPTSSDLRGYMLERLPNYMVPSVFVPLDAMPLMPNGKVNRRALPAPDISRSNLEEPFVAPRTPTEETLADIFAVVLQLKQVGIHDNFFELGGHSLLATQVNSRIRKTFQLDFPLRDIFEKPTVAELAEQVETIRWANEIPDETDEDREEGEL